MNARSVPNGTGSRLGRNLPKTPPASKTALTFGLKANCVAVRTRPDAGLKVRFYVISALSIMSLSSGQRSAASESQAERPTASPTKSTRNRRYGRRQAPFPLREDSVAS
jgi:hypothetical protein